jgi:hypothetical protein
MQTSVADAARGRTNTDGELRDTGERVNTHVVRAHDNYGVWLQIGDLLAHLRKCVIDRRL